MPRDQLLEARAACAPAGRGLATRGRVTARRWASQTLAEAASPLTPRRPSNRRVVCRRCALGAQRAGDISFAPQVTLGGPILGKFGRTGTVKDRLLYNEGPIP